MSKYYASLTETARSAITAARASNCQRVLGIARKSFAEAKDNYHATEWMPFDSKDTMEDFLRKRRVDNPDIVPVVAFNPNAAEDTIEEILAKRTPYPNGGYYFPEALGLAVAA